MIVRSLRLFPETFGFGTRRETGNDFGVTFDGVGLYELRTIYKQWFWNGLPRGYRLWKTEVHVCRGKLVDVKPDVLRPCVFNQIFIWDTPVSQG